jgi:hypothetical protein
MGKPRFVDLALKGGTGEFLPVRFQRFTAAGNNARIRDCLRITIMLIAELKLVLLIRALETIGMQAWTSASLHFDCVAGLWIEPARSDPAWCEWQRRA